MSRAHHNIRGLYVICDPAFLKGRDVLEIASEALRGGATVVQLRDKTHTIREQYPLATKLSRLVKDNGALFIVNDSLELAMACDADGVHLGQDDMPLRTVRKVAGEKMIIGISTHTLDEALEAQEDGADYIGFGPIFETTTKDSGAPKGPEGLKALRDRIKIPIVAIGGINPGNISKVIAAGADAVAVITAVSAADDSNLAARELTRFFED